MLIASLAIAATISAALLYELRITLDERLESADPNSFDSTASSYLVGRIFPDTASLADGSNLGEIIEGTECNFYMATFAGQAISTTYLNSVQRLLERGKRTVRVVINDPGGANASGYDSMTAALSRPVNNREIARTATSVFVSLKKFGLEKNSSFEARFHTGPQFYNMWLRDTECNGVTGKRRLGHVSLLTYSGATGPGEVAFRFGPLSEPRDSAMGLPSTLLQFSREFDTIWSRALPAPSP